MCCYFYPQHHWSLFVFSGIRIIPDIVPFGLRVVSNFGYGDCGGRRNTPAGTKSRGDASRKLIWRSPCVAVPRVFACAHISVTPQFRGLLAVYGFLLTFFFFLFVPGFCLQCGKRPLRPVSWPETHPSATAGR